MCYLRVFHEDTLLSGMECGRTEQLYPEVESARSAVHGQVNLFIGRNNNDSTPYAGYS